MIYDPSSKLYARFLNQRANGIMDRSVEGCERALLFILSAESAWPECNDTIVHFIWWQLGEIIRAKIAKAKVMHGGNISLAVKVLNSTPSVPLVWCPWDGMMMRWQTSHHHDKDAYIASSRGLILFESQGMFASEVSAETCKALEHTGSKQVTILDGNRVVWYVNRRCTYCDSDAPTQKCSACDGIARYCSKSCQLAHWPEHKIACESARRSASMFDRF
jgi:hypothetical protein